MIVWITHVKVGHRQTPHSKALMLTHQGFNHLQISNQRLTEQYTSTRIRNI